MNNLFTYLVELNISLMILFMAYKLFFEKDKNFTIRRIYLLGVIILPAILPLLPASVRMPVSQFNPVTIHLEGVTVLGVGSAASGPGHLSLTALLLIAYVVILSLGIIKVVLQLARITHAINHSERFEVNGITLISCPSLHASSFFGYIFIDPATIKDSSFNHILEHENTHKKEWHSIDRILAEIFVIINWFNPVAWMFRKSVIQNLEYLADSAVLRRGTDPTNYQLSILNQYIGSASISNQFSNHIKNRINMLNKNYKLGSRWKLALLLPLTLIAFFIVSCTDKDAPVNPIEPAEVNAQDIAPSPDLLESEVFYIVEEMPTFNGDDTYKEFRMYIARNLKYPPEAAEAGVTGKVYITFVVSNEGKVLIPDEEFLTKNPPASPIDEVVVVAYRTLNEDEAQPDEKYIKLLQEEVIRVVSSSPDWEPGRQRGKAVNVMFTFPVTFALQ